MDASDNDFLLEIMHICQVNHISTLIYACTQTYEFYVCVARYRLGLLLMGKCNFKTIQNTDIYPEMLLELELFFPTTAS